MKRLQADPDQHISFQSYVRWVRTYETEQALIATGRICHMIETDDERLKDSRFLSKHDVGQWQLALFAKTLIEASNDFRNERVRDEELYLACNYYNNLRESIPADGASGPEGRREVLNNLIRLSYAQFPFQIQNHRADIPRALILFERIAAEAKQEFDVDRSFRELTGLSVREFVMHGFAVWAICGNGEIPPVMEQSDYWGKRLLPKEKQQHFRDLISADYTQFRNCQSGQDQKAGLEKQQFNCLHRYPLIRTQKSKKLVCPIPLLLLRRVTRGIYYQLQDAYSGGGQRNPFTTFFGKKLFEPYVGMQLRDLSTATELIPEQRIGSEDTCDWILVENDAITLIECKSVGLTFKSKALAETEDVAEDLRRRIVKAVQAFERTRIALEAGIPGLERLKGKTTRNLIVFYDDIFLFNAPQYRELVDGDLASLGLGTVPFQIAAIRDLEIAIPILRERGLARVLDEKIADRERATWDLGSFLSRLIEEGSAKANGPNRILNEEFERFFSELAPNGDVT